jgi:glycosyltransferase involved in cell wall biosynthesis
VNTLSTEIHSLAASKPRKAKRRLARYRRLYDGHRVTTVSEGVKDDLLDVLNLRPQDIVTIYNPFDLGQMREAAKAPTPDLPQQPYVLHVGRLARQKRHDVLLDAFAKASIPHRLIMITRDEDIDGLMQMVVDRGLQPRVTVSRFRENVFPWYAHAAALVLSSDFEGMPNVVVEALAVGTPVVSTDCRSGPREALTGPLERYLVPCGDADALASRLEEIVENPPRIDPATVSRFSIDHSLDMIESLVGRTAGSDDGWLPHE